MRIFFELLLPSLVPTQTYDKLIKCYLFMMHSESNHKNVLYRYFAKFYVLRVKKISRKN